MADAQEHMKNARSRERCWLVVADDGTHSIIGRHSDPSKEELDGFAAQVDRRGLTAWLVVSEGVYFSQEPVTLMVVRRISAADGDWATAERRWHDRRTTALA